MISEYIGLQTAVSQRAIQIGRILQHEHYAMEYVQFPAAVPGLSGVTETEVSILVGMNADQEWACINVPIPLFETGTPADIRVWSYSQNEANAKRVRALEDKDSESKRAGEIAILKELLVKYPEVMNE